MARYLYIPGWRSNFERSQARRFDRLPWVTQSTNLNHPRYLDLVTAEDGTPQKDGAANYGVYRSIIALAATCNPRGVLALPDGSPHSDATIARATRMPVRVISVAVSALLKVGLLRSAESVESACASEREYERASERDSDPESERASERGYDAGQGKAGKGKAGKGRQQQRTPTDAEPEPPSDAAAAELVSALRGFGIDAAGVSAILATNPLPSARHAGEWWAEIQRRPNVRNPAGMLIDALCERWTLPEKPASESAATRNLLAAGARRTELFERAAKGDQAAIRELRGDGSAVPA